MILPLQNIPTKTNPSKNVNFSNKINVAQNKRKKIENMAQWMREGRTQPSYGEALPLKLDYLSPTKIPGYTSSNKFLQFAGI